MAQFKVPIYKTIIRLKKLTLRQLACSLMCHDKSKKTFCMTLTWLSKVGQEKKKEREHPDESYKAFIKALNIFLKMWQRRKKCDNLLFEFFSFSAPIPINLDHYVAWFSCWSITVLDAHFFSMPSFSPWTASDILAHAVMDVHVSPGGALGEPQNF